MASLMRAVGTALVAVGVVVVIAALVAPAQTAIFIVRGLRPLDLTASYDVSTGTLTLVGTGADARLVEIVIGVFIAVVGAVIRRQD